MPSMFLTPISAGIAAAACFAALSLMGMNSLFLIFSAIPLLYLGYTQPFVPLVIATAIASFILLLFNPVSSLFFIAVIGVPSFFLCAYHKRGESLNSVMIDICGYAIVALAAIQISLLESGGMQGWLAAKFSDADIGHLDPQLIEQVIWLSQEGSYLLIGVVIWWGVLFLLIASWLTEKLLHTRQNQPSLPYITYFSSQTPPSWPLIGLFISAVIGLISPENLRFLGLVTFVIILLPYAFYGAMYTPLKNTLKKSLGWSLVAMMVMMILAWPAVIIAGWGVLKHAQAVIAKE